jgi:3-mercaptopyruvate sulfurtransferase SseA
MCNTGKMASVVPLALELLGFSSYLYDESLSGWEDSAPLTDTEKQKIRSEARKL